MKSKHTYKLFLPSKQFLAPHTCLHYFACLASYFYVIILSHNLQINFLQKIKLNHQHATQTFLLNRLSFIIIK